MWKKIVKTTEVVYFYVAKTAFTMQFHEFFFHTWILNSRSGGTPGRVGKTARGRGTTRGRGGRGAGGRGSGGRGRGRGAKKGAAPKAEDLDAEMDTYMKARS